MFVDYGPLSGLIGTWEGDNGVDIAPDPKEGQEENHFFETLVFSKAGSVLNADQERLAVLHYHQIVTRKKDKAVIHNQTGYWMYDKSNERVIQSIAIPRAVCVLAAGTATSIEKGYTFVVQSDERDKNWGIIQSPFMEEHARTVAFRHTMKLQGDRLEYFETTSVDIYGNRFEHTDTNILTRR